MKHRLGLLVLLLSVWLTACDTNTVYSEYEDIEDGKWFVNHAPAFTFRIEDANQRYNVYYNLRNALSYPYYNLYLTRYLSDSSGRVIESRLDELILMDPKTGEPRGDGLGDIFDHKVLIKPNYQFPKPGQYTIRIKQYMRQNPLPDVLSVGISVEKAGK
ncbi:gliding motility lipoprotein GldH [Rudanella paleaurantiibacter]|uniref:Gliding motility lipoprotein GldH n=1 Tax=Rudanella paleaurantiibacter TaxID=2614655 RepID=A0A7J5U1D4_9BACT|nr:gliding motility lipoprotein GldH [Rudanella paleaurantiibacter]KAB7731614.1 gliding motility lipoprotein GldH [Rudanella paleaurantiibacter]